MPNGISTTLPPYLFNYSNPNNSNHLFLCPIEFNERVMPLKIPWFVLTLVHTLYYSLCIWFTLAALKLYI